MPRSDLKLEAEVQRIEALERYQKSLWAIGTDLLEYGFNPTLRLGLTGRMHQPICEWLDYHESIGTERTVVVCERGFHKSTMGEARQLKQMLNQPWSTNLYLTNSDDLCNDVAGSMANHYRFNDRLRALDPVGESPVLATGLGRVTGGKPTKLFPSKLSKKFHTATAGNISIKLNRPYGTKSRGASWRYRTWKSEGGGKHVDGLCILDDPIGRAEVERSEVQKVTRWVQNTVLQIVDSRRWLMLATFWPGKTIVHDWVNDPDVASIVLPAAVAEPDAEIVARLARGERKVHFDPDYKFSNPTFWLGEACPEKLRSKVGPPAARKLLKQQQRTEGGEFPEQRMCDPEPASEKPWGPDCEHLTGIQKTATTPGVLGDGAVFVLADPAPYLQGGYKGLTEKQRGDGTKDEWVFEVWKLRPRGDILDRILLDGVASQEWGHKEGAEEAARLMKKWRTNLFISESQDEHYPHMLEACMRQGVHLRRTRQNGPLKFASYNRADRKNVDFIAMAEAARRGEVWICSETVPKEFLGEDQEHKGLLPQCRKWRKTGQGTNSLRFDDRADLMGRAFDDALREFAPTPEALRRRQVDDIFKQDDAAAASGRSRYCGL